jgi:hypothetical protein
MRLDIGRIKSCKHNTELVIYQRGPDITILIVDTAALEEGQRCTIKASQEITALLQTLVEEVRESQRTKE